MNKKLKGFSLVELMISLLIISVVLSATLPGITRKAGSSFAFPVAHIGNVNATASGAPLTIVADPNYRQAALYNGTTVFGYIATNTTNGLLLASNNTLENNKVKIGKNYAYTNTTVLFGSKTLKDLGATSDIRKKNILGDSTAGLKEINKIKVYNFTYKDDKKKEPQVGVIAQEIKEVFPHSVYKDGEGYYAVTQHEMFYAMLNSIKELAAKFTGLDKKITELEEQNKQLQEQNAEFEKRLCALENKKIDKKSKQKIKKSKKTEEKVEEKSEENKNIKE